MVTLWPRCWSCEGAGRLKSYRVLAASEGGRGRAVVIVRRSSGEDVRERSDGRLKMEEELVGINLCSGIISTL